MHVFAVLRQVAGLREGLSTGDAGVGAAAGMDSLVHRQAAGRGEGLSAGGAFVGAVAGVGAHVPRPVAGLRAGLAADRALDKVDLVPRCTAPPLARRSRASTLSFVSRLFPAPLACAHRATTLHVCLDFETVLVKPLKQMKIRGGIADQKLSTTLDGKSGGTLLENFFFDSGWARLGEVKLAAWGKDLKDLKDPKGKPLHIHLSHSLAR